MKQKAKIAISLAFHIVTTGVGLFSRAVGRPIPPRLIILYYHAVPSVLRHSFARQLDMLVQRAKVVPAEYHEAVSATARSVAITFDDAFVSVIENALPELRARNLPVTVFVPAGTLGRHPSWEMEDSSTDAGEVIASAEALRSLPSQLYLKMSGAYAWMPYASAAKQWLKGLLTRRDQTRS